MNGLCYRDFISEPRFTGKFLFELAKFNFWISVNSVIYFKSSIPGGGGVSYIFKRYRIKVNTVLIEHDYTSTFQFLVNLAIIVACSCGGVRAIGFVAFKSLTPTAIDSVGVIVYPYWQNSITPWYNL